MSEKENGLAGWQKAIQELSNYEPTDKYVLAIHRIKQLEQELESAKKDQARYKFVRDMPSEDFGNLSTINDDFDCQIDAAIAAKESSK